MDFDHGDGDEEDLATGWLDTMFCHYIYELEKENKQTNISIYLCSGMKVSVLKWKNKQNKHKHLFVIIIIIMIIS